MKIKGYKNYLQSRTDMPNNINLNAKYWKIVGNIISITAVLFGFIC